MDLSYFMIFLDYPDFPDFSKNYPGLVEISRFWLFLIMLIDSIDPPMNL